MHDNHKPNHKCLACGVEYYACDSCDKKIEKTWRAACCTEEHYNAYYAMWQYGQGQISKEEARAVLEEQDALSWEKAPGRALIEEIMDFGKDINVPDKEMDEPEKAVAEEPEDNQNESEQVEEQPVAFASRKKKRR